MAKLTDTQLIILSSASRRDDGLVVIPKTLGDVAAKVIKPLLGRELLAEITAKPDMPVWRRDEEKGPQALQITKSGLMAIGVEGESEAPSRKRGPGTKGSKTAKDSAAARQASVGRIAKSRNPAARAGAKGPEQRRNAVGLKAVRCHRHAGRLRAVRLGAWLISRPHACDKSRRQSA
jgi:hypothetical protein